MVYRSHGRLLAGLPAGQFLGKKGLQNEEKTFFLFRVSFTERSIICSENSLLHSKRMDKIGSIYSIEKCSNLAQTLVQWNHNCLKRLVSSFLH